MLKTTLLLASLLGGILMGTSAQASLAFDFSFGGFCVGCEPSEEPGTVEGVVSGLVDDVADQTATSVIVTGTPTSLEAVIGRNFVDPVALGTGEAEIFRNSFTVEAGAITAFSFAGFLEFGDLGETSVLCLNDTVGLCGEGTSSLFQQPVGAVRTQGAPGVEGVDFIAADGTGPGQPVPLPASVALLGLGLLALRRFR